MSGLEIAAIITAVCGVPAIVIAVLRYRREDTGMVVGQQAEIVAGMRTLYETLQEAYDRLKVVEECLEEKLAEAATELAVETAELKEVREALGRALQTIRDLEARANGNGSPDEVVDDERA